MKLQIWSHQSEIYELIIRNAWATVNTFSNLSQRVGSRLQGCGGRAASLGISGSLSVSRRAARKNILSDKEGEITFRYQNSETKKWETRTLEGEEFLRKILLHILPKGFRRARNFGFLHPNSKLVKLVQLIKQVFVPPPQPRPAAACPCCGKPLRIVRTRVRYAQYPPPRATFEPEMIM